MKKLDGGLGGVEPKYFAGPGIDFTLATFLVLWLSRNVVDTQPQDRVNVHMFRLATLLAHGKHVALGPLFLGTLYRWLDLIFDFQIRSQDRYDVVTYLVTSFFQMFRV